MERPSYAQHLFAASPSASGLSTIATGDTLPAPSSPYPLSLVTGLDILELLDVYQEGVSLPSHSTAQVTEAVNTL